MVRTQNRRLVLHHLRTHGPTSRVELAQATGLSGAAVTQLTGDLLQEGFLVTGTGGSGGVGRRPVPLSINYGGFFAIGVKLMDDHLQAVLTDLSARVVAGVTMQLPPRLEVEGRLKVEGGPESRVSLESKVSPEVAAAQIGQAVLRLMSDGQVSARQLIGVGIGMGGVVDAERGVSVLSPRLGWQEVGFARLVSEQTGAATWIDNDSNAFAAAQSLFGYGARVENFLVVIVGQGIGAGLVLRGELYRGFSGGAGEIGHTVSEPGGRRCACGQAGCLEAYASEDGLLSRWSEGYPHLKLAGPLDLATLATDAGTEGHAEARALLEDGGGRLGRSLSHLVNALNPELLVFGGEGVRLGEPYFTALRLELFAHVYPPLAKNLRLATETWGDDVWARGAASLAIRHAFLSAALPTS